MLGADCNMNVNYFDTLQLALGRFITIFSKRIYN